MIKRAIFSQLVEHLSKPEISVLIGPRQAGKTTLMRLLDDFLNKQGSRTVFFNLDIEHDKQYFHSQDYFIQKLHLEFGGKSGYVFIDEIQRKQDSGLFLKGIYDMNLPYKLIVSGSGSLELKEKIHESLTGRKRLFEINTLSFTEFVNFRTDYKYENKLNEFFEVEHQKTNFLLEEYMSFGGYPRVVLENQSAEKRNVIAEIFQSYLEKDIGYLLGLEKTDALINLVKILASQIGKLLNLSELSSTVGLAIATVKLYLWYLEKTFIIQKCTPFFKNMRKEITKSSMRYFTDLGMRNYAIGQFGNSAENMDGFIFQNFIFNVIKGMLTENSETVHFWRSKDKAEVDIVINKISDLIPIEIKYTKLTKDIIPPSLKSFIEKYNPKTAYVINLYRDSRIKLNKTEIHIIPYYKLLSLGI